MMDLIYACATVVIVAVSGNNSNAGLPGISHPRAPQFKEKIGDQIFFTVPQETSPQIKSSVWKTRAWTFQEGILGTRYLWFIANKLHYTYLRTSISDAEGVASTVEIPVNETDTAWSYFTKSRDPDDKLTEEDAIANCFVFNYMLCEYTSRRLTNPSDSLNGFLGLISVFEKHMFPGGFTWGLPL